ncbi:MAG TPA: hypothetical protein VGX49_03265 [Jatrophihabitans sp.]|nr:hypothetical protein [Jatrophihabitans sp.]
MIDHREPAPEHLELLQLGQHVGIGQLAEQIGRHVVEVARQLMDDTAQRRGCLSISQRFHGSDPTGRV